MKHILTVALALSASVAVTSNATAESEKIGQATRIQTAVNGDSGELAVKGPVHRDERISTSKAGLGEFLFRDGTKLAVGWGSSVVIDKFIFDDSNSLKKLSIRAVKGTFRWVSGNSKSSAYEIVTPAGTIGVRGTKFDFYVGGDGTTAVVLLSGHAQFCGGGGCVQLQRRCDCVIAKRGTKPSVSRASRQTLISLGNVRALPFLSGNQNLSGGFGASSGCGMSVASILETPNPQEHKAQEKSAPTKPDRPDPHKPDTHKPDTHTTNPGTPDTHKPDTHTTDPGTPNTPDTPDTPNTPDTKGGHGYGDKNHQHDHKHDGDNAPDTKGDKGGHDGKGHDQGGGKGHKS